jgi:hypothetical protein
MGAHPLGAAYGYADGYRRGAAGSPESPEGAITGWSDSGIIGIDMAERADKVSVFAFGASTNVPTRDASPTAWCSNTSVWHRYQRLSPTPTSTKPSWRESADVGDQPDCKAEQLAHQGAVTIADGEHDRRSIRAGKWR